VTIYGRGGQLSFVVPAVYGGAIAITAVVGWTILGDVFSWSHLAGVAGIVIGIGLLAFPAK
jgi:drug/metabolite transporter (DMT)-like permease